MEIIPLIVERDVAIQRARAAQNRDVRTQAKACLLLGRYHKEQGELDKAEALYQRALATARSLQAHEMEADACSGLGLMYLKSTGFVYYSVLGGVYRQMGRLDEAAAMYRRTLAVQQKLGNRLFEARTLSGLGQVLREKGDLREAAALFQQARGLFGEIGDNKSGGIQAALLGNVYMDVEDFDAAEEAYRLAMQLFLKVSDLEAVADVKVSLGRVYASNQAPFDALLQWRQALELYRELERDDKIEFVEELLKASGLM